MTFLSSIVKTILLGIIQGITEWLPISSTGHLILFASIWPLEPATFFEVFKVVIQFGSILAVLVFLVEKNPRQEKIETIEQVDYVSALKIGCFQCLALIPGTSRSGATILGGLYCGCSRTVASEFSFFLAIPVMFGASLLKVIKYFIKVGLFSFGQLFLLLLGTFVAFVVSLFAIKALLNYVKSHDFTIFGWYRIILGIFVIIFFYVI